MKFEMKQLRRFLQYGINKYHRNQSMGTERLYTHLGHGPFVFTWASSLLFKGSVRLMGSDFSDMIAVALGGMTRSKQRDDVNAYKGSSYQGSIREAAEVLKKFA